MAVGRHLQSRDAYRLPLTSIGSLSPTHYLPHKSVELTIAQLASPRLPPHAWEGENRVRDPPQRGFSVFNPPPRRERPVVAEREDALAVVSNHVG
jgi:hypothetical protein